MTPKRQNRLRIFAGALFALIALANQGAVAREQILTFHADIVVGANGTLSVKETIRVNAERRLIRRGIYRDFPVRYVKKSGYWRHVGFTLISVRRNGKPEPYHTERIGNAIRIYAGKSNRFVPRGEHTYTFKYTTTRQLRHFKDFDEIFWNVTGNFWRFPITHATARIVLPEGAHIVQKAAYTGYAGTKGQNYRITSETARTIEFETTRPLRRREGLSVAVAFPKGIVPEPSGLTSIALRLWDNIGFLILGFGTLAAGVYFYLVWHRLGRDPEQGLVIPLFAPPSGLSPAATSYIHFWGFKTTSGTPLAFIAALISLAVKGRMRISEDDDKQITLEAIRDRETARDRAGLPAGERVLERRFLVGRDSLTFDDKQGKKIHSALSAFKRSILREYEGRFFRDNYFWLAGGAVISALAIAGFALLNTPSEKQFGMMVVVFVSGFVGLSFLLSGLWRLFGWKPGGGSLWLGGLMTAVGVGTLALFGMLLIGGAALTAPAGPICAGAIGIMNVTFFFLLRAPTVIGREIMDRIEGFKLYLSTAEAERMNLNDAPDMSQDLFEEFLPYAIALGVEEPWSNAFSAHIKRVAPGTASGGYHPHWYSGGSWSSRSLGAATSSIASSIASSTASAMPSSSGSGGGGFSGGGGGGGGGGGW